MVADEPVWLCKTQRRQSRASVGRGVDRKKFMDEDVDEMILGD